MSHNGTEAAPDWDTIDREVVCSRCGYNLRMLTLPRCPECGLTFRWVEVLADSLLHPFLFEHNWRKRPVRSWFGNILRAMRPRRFWRSVSVHEPIRTGPLLFMFISAPLCVLVATIAISGSVYISTKVLLWIVASQSLSGRPRLIMLEINDTSLNSLSSIPQHLGIYWRIMAISLGMQLLLLLFIFGLRQTLGRCRVRGIQVVRLVAYTAPGTVVAGSALVYCMVAIVVVSIRITGGPGSSFPVWACLILLPGIVIYYVHAGLRYYLELPRSFWTAALGSVTVLLFVLTAFAVYEVM